MDLGHIRRGIVVTAFLTLFTVLMVDTWPVDKHRSKRTIIQMCGLISLYTNRSCLDYNNYGCFCGLGNAGRKPLDTVDACCWRHDYCYGLVDCFWMYPQLVGYNIHCHQGRCECTDSMESSPCARTTCECDVRFASCLAEGQFHNHYVNYDRVLCAQQPWSDRTEQDEDEEEVEIEADTDVQEVEEQTESTPEPTASPAAEEQTETAPEETHDSRPDSEDQIEIESEEAVERESIDNNSRREAVERESSDNSRREAVERESSDSNSRRESAEPETASESSDNNSRREIEERTASQDSYNDYEHLPVLT
ncbi:otoconin-90-like [Gigantopelta aegis]|uniref:otoconin-90-like n=1 Tax=Gigantopelta aegis TaxID=1735272 RepID=UPI001B88A43E|nr:otoconin-90-like [Gigantopelta aegis]